VEQAQQPQIVTPEQQRALEQNVYVGAAAAKVSNSLLLSIDTHLRLIKWAAWAIAACAIALTIKFL